MTMILRDFGKSENDLGIWFNFGEEHPAPFEVRVRRVPYDVANKISKRYGKEIMVTVDGLRRPTVERDIDQTTKWLYDQAAWAWVDARGLGLEIADEEAAKLWSGLLKREVKVGETLELSGSALTHEAKMRVLLHIRPFAVMTDAETQKKERQDLGTVLVLTAAKLQQGSVDAEQEALGNS